MISISLFYCCDKVFTHMNSWMIGKNLLTDYKHAKRVCKDFEKKYLGQHHVLFVHSDTLSLANVSENLRNMCLEIYEIDPIRFFTAPGLV